MLQTAPSTSRVGGRRRTDRRPPPKMRTDSIQSELSLHESRSYKMHVHSIRFLVVYYVPPLDSGGYLYSITFACLRDPDHRLHYDPPDMCSRKSRQLVSSASQRHITRKTLGGSFPPPTGLYPESWDHPTKPYYRYSASRRYRGYQPKRELRLVSRWLVPPTLHTTF